MNSRGFTMLELLLVLVLIGIIGRMLMTTRMFKPAILETFGRNLNALMSIAQTQALVTSHQHRVFFDFDGQLVRLEISGTMSTTGRISFVPVELKGLATSMRIDPQLDIRHLYIEGREYKSGSRTEKAWFFINAKGVAQQVVLVVENRETGAMRVWELNPLTVQFKERDTVPTCAH